MPYISSLGASRYEQSPHWRGFLTLPTNVLPTPPLATAKPSRYSVLEDGLEQTKHPRKSSHPQTNLRKSVTHHEKSMRQTLRIRGELQRLQPLTDSAPPNTKLAGCVNSLSERPLLLQRKLSAPLTVPVPPAPRHPESPTLPPPGRLHPCAPAAPLAWTARLGESRPTPAG